MFQYWETWENNAAHTVHWGKLGERGQSEAVRNSLFSSALKKVTAEIAKKKAEGFQEIPIEDHHTLLIEFAIEGMGNATDLKKRHGLEERMNETLGWTGLGLCDGGSIGSGTMEVCCYVVDFQIAKDVITRDLQNTEFKNFTRIYREDDEGLN